MGRDSTVIACNNLKFCFNTKWKKPHNWRCTLLHLEMSNTVKVKSDVQSYFKVQIISVAYIFQWKIFLWASVHITAP